MSYLPKNKRSTFRKILTGFSIALENQCGHYAAVYKGTTAVRVLTISEVITDVRFRTL